MLLHRIIYLCIAFEVICAEDEFCSASCEDRYFYLLNERSTKTHQLIKAQIKNDEQSFVSRSIDCVILSWAGH